jgi:hypothetical protein
MTKRTRYFMAGSAAVLAAGLTAGLIAYYGGGFQALSASTGPTELSYVPADATVVAYADVRAIMDSELRMRLKAAMPGMTDKGQEEFQQHTGIDIERDIDYVVAATTAGGDVSSPSFARGGLVVARGRFNDTQLETLAVEHGARVETYKGKRLLLIDKPATHDAEPTSATPEDITTVRHTGVLAFLEPGLVAIGDVGAVKRAIDAQLSAQSITLNTEMMDLVSDIERSNNAWAVGRFDIIASRAKLPEQVARQIPAVKWFAATSYINGGISGSLRAEARDDVAAENLRDVVRGFLALGRMQAQADPKVSQMVNSLQLSGTGKTVTLSFSVPSEILELMVPKAHAQ